MTDLKFVAIHFEKQRHKHFFPQHQTRSQIIFTNQISLTCFPIIFDQQKQPPRLPNRQSLYSSSAEKTQAILYLSASVSWGNTFRLWDLAAGAFITDQGEEAFVGCIG